MESIRELRDEHDALSGQAFHVRHALASGDRGAARVLLDELVSHLVQHVTREELGMFAALRTQGEFADEVAALEGEHRAMDAVVADLDLDGPDFVARVTALLDDLEAHIEREDLGIFPVAVVTLGATGWATVEAAHEQHPTFLAPDVRSDV
ncbi:hemerythrin domain-containing protein [Nocardioides szechwanensis]|uniref:hemerythrin domain-containing protein n=1 Tax=Nocardioides szechwanensis TaxID=1005944 RepID=UPI00147852CE|nr:hemerythrin domain-containing protein [Nocardioides szechwanensis]